MLLQKEYKGRIAAGHQIAREAKMDKLLTELGPDFEAAWELVEDTDPASEDGKVLNAAVDRVADRCPD
jgi:hypothetical protein